MDKNIYVNETFKEGRNTWHNTKAVFYGTAATTVLLLLLGIIANIIILVVMIRTRKIRRSLSNFFIFHLSVVESIFRLITIPIHIYSRIPSTIENSTMIPICKTWSFISSAWGSAIFLSLTGIALDRYNNILHPMKSRTAKHNYLFILIAVWSYAVVVSAPFIYSTSSFLVTELDGAASRAFWNQFNENCENCLNVGIPHVCDHKTGWSSKLSATTYFLLSFFVPLLIICAAYARIVSCLWQRSRQQGIRNKTVARSKTKAVRMVIMMVLGYSLCWGPITIFNMLQTYHIFKEAPHTTLIYLGMVTIVLLNSSSVVNPLIYAYYNSNFREQFVRDYRSCAGHLCRHSPENRSLRQDFRMQERIKT